MTVTTVNLKRNAQKGPYAVCILRMPRSACAFAQADLGIRCPLTESMNIVVYVTNRECSDQTARMRTHSWTIAVHILYKGLLTKLRSMRKCIFGNVCSRKTQISCASACPPEHILNPCLCIRCPMKTGQIFKSNS